MGGVMEGRVGELRRLLNCVVGLFVSVLLLVRLSVFDFVVCGAARYLLWN